MVGQHEDRYLVHGVLPPPAPPAFFGPRSTHRPEHISAHDPRADVLEPSNGKLFVYAGFSAILPKQLLLKGARGERPAMQRSAANAQRMLQILVRASAETVQRNGEAFYAKPGHGASLFNK